MATVWHRAKWLILPAIALGCTANASAPAAGGVAIAFAALEGTQACSATWNGTGTPPAAGADAVDRLTLRWTELDTGKSATASITAKEVASNGTWNVGVLPVSQQLQLQVYACTADNRVVWYGKGSDFVVKQGEDTTARVFMTPPGKLACAGNAGAGGTLQTPRAFAGGAALTTGNAIAVGGADKWDGTLAKASVATDIYDYKLGTWRAGPTLLAARIWPQVLPLDATHVLVAGGSARLQKTNNTLPITLFAPDDLSSAALVAPAAEVLDVQTEGAKSAAAVANIGSGVRPFASATVAGDTVVFAGGLGEDNKALATGARVRGLAEIANLGAGTTDALTLAAARVQPNVLAYADGAVVVWGGQVSAKAADFGELIDKDGKAGALLTVTGDAILTDPNAQAMGAAAVVLSEQGDVLTFFITGGIPVDAGWATGTPSYIVIVDRVARTAVCKKVALPADTVLPGGIGVAATRLDGGYILVSGGLLGLGKLASSADPQSQCQTDDQTKTGCLVSGFVLLAPPADLTPAQVAMTAVKIDGLSPMGPHFGQIAVALPVGAVLTGGLATVVSLPASATDAFDAAAQIVSAPFSAAANQAACKP